MPEIAVDLAIAGMHPCSGQSSHNYWRYRRREQAVSPAQHVQDLRPDFGKLLYRVVANSAAPQDDQRICIPPPCPVDGLLANLGLARFAARVARSQCRLDSVAL